MTKMECVTLGKSLQKDLKRKDTDVFDNNKFKTSIH